MSKTTLGDYIGNDLEDDFLSFDLTEIKKVLDALQSIDAIDLAHAEFLQQQALRGADILSEYLGKIVKTTAYLEGKVNTIKNKVSLEYEAPDGSKTTTDMKIWAAGASTEVADVQNKLARAKGSKIYLEKKYDILIKSHHHYKEIAMGLRKTVLGYNNTTNQEKIPEGWD